MTVSKRASVTELLFTPCCVKQRLVCSRIYGKKRLAKGLLGKNIPWESFGHRLYARVYFHRLAEGLHVYNPKGKVARLKRMKW